MSVYFGFNENTSIAVINAAIQGGANVNEILKETGETPLHHATKIGHLEFVKALIAAGAKANEKNLRSQTPLHNAAGHNDLEIVKILLNAGADITDKDYKNRQPIFYAIAKFRGNDWDAEMIEILKGDLKLTTQDSSGRFLGAYAYGDYHFELMQLFKTDSLTIKEEITPA